MSEIQEIGLALQQALNDGLIREYAHSAYLEPPISKFRISDGAKEMEIVFDDRDQLVEPRTRREVVAGLAQFGISVE